jgi:hypothetical protein
VKNPRPTPPPAEEHQTEVVTRLRRIESRVVQLMKHVGMKTDGRTALPEDKPAHPETKEN